MDKNKLDSEIYKIIDESKNMKNNCWDFMIKNNLINEEFYEFIFSKITIELTKERHIRYTKDKITHIVKNCIEDLNDDE